MCFVPNSVTVSWSNPATGFKQVANLVTDLVCNFFLLKTWLQLHS